MIHPPAYYSDLLTDLPEGVVFDVDAKCRKDIIHLFARNTDEIYGCLSIIKNEIRPNGMIWVSWYKKASKIPTDVTKDIIREAALLHGLVDVKVCTVDETWSALKLVIPLKSR